jgi:hypothetical protein
VPSRAKNQSLIGDHDEASADARETAVVTPWRPTALALLIAAAQATGFHADPPSGFSSIQVDFGHLSGTNMEFPSVPSRRTAERELFAVINDIYDRLLKNSHDLDLDSHRILYENRWVLYE